MHILKNIFDFGALKFWWVARSLQNGYLFYHIKLKALAVKL